jgi:hypothetical protein
MAAGPTGCSYAHDSDVTGGAAEGSKPWVAGTQGHSLTKTNASCLTRVMVYVGWCRIPAHTAGSRVACVAAGCRSHSKPPSALAVFGVPTWSGAPRRDCHAGRGNPHDHSRCGACSPGRRPSASPVAGRHAAQTARSMSWLWHARQQQPQGGDNGCALRCRHRYPASSRAGATQGRPTVCCHHTASALHRTACAHEFEVNLRTADQRSACADGMAAAWRC